MDKKQTFSLALLFCALSIIHAQEKTEAKKPEAEYIHEFWVKGNHANELGLGNYVVVAQTITEADAKKLIQEYKKLDFPQPKYGYQSNKGFWMIGFSVEGDILDAKAAHKKYTVYSLYKSAWLLTIHD